MGKRKKSSRKPQGPRKNEPLPTNFTCLFCNHENSVSVKLDRRAGVGTLECKMCAQKFQCGINYLSAAIDVYSEWVDAADSIATGGAGIDPQEGVSRPKPGMSSGLAAEEDDDRGGYEGEGIVGDEEYD